MAKLIAVVNDDRDCAETMIESLSRRLPDVKFSHFVTGDTLVELLKLGKKFDAYLVDLNPLAGAIDGLECTEQICRIQADAVVIGTSSIGNDPIRVERTKRIFLSHGARDFVKVADGPYAMADALRRLLAQGG